MRLRLRKKKWIYFIKDKILILKLKFFQREYTQEILALIEINSAHCKRYHALEKAYRDLTVEYAAYKQMVGMSSTSSESADVNTVCNKHEGLIRKLKEENGWETQSVNITTSSVDSPSSVLQLVNNDKYRHKNFLYLAQDELWHPKVWDLCKG